MKPLVESLKGDQLMCVYKMTQTDDQILVESPYHYVRTENYNCVYLIFSHNLLTMRFN